jgi:hypothetical protein
MEENEFGFPPDEPVAARYTALARRLQERAPNAEEDLYRLFASGVRWMLRQALGDARAESEIRSVLTSVAETVRAGALLEPSRLPHLVRMLVRDCIRERARSSSAGAMPPLQKSGHRRGEVSREQIMHGLLGTMPARDREVLRRFYLQHQSVHTICQELRITAGDVEIVTAAARAQFREESRAAHLPSSRQKSSPQARRFAF